MPMVAVVLLPGCGRKDPLTSTPNQTASVPAEGQSTNSDSPASTAPQSAELRQTLSVVENSIKGGSYDEAAANLLKVRINGTKFSQEDAVAYRKALSDAYSRALEAASKGDPKAKAALQMIRAAGPH